MNDDLLPLPCEEVVTTEFADNEGVLVDLSAKRYYLLNETALLVWRAVEANRTLADVVQEVTEVYEVTPEDATESVRRLLKNLADYRLVLPRD